MTIFLLSLRCGHCVYSAAVMGNDEFYAAKRRAAGRPCPVCGARVVEDELRGVTTSEDLRAVEDGAVPWDRARRPGGGFAGFGGPEAAQSFPRGAFAESLRRKVFGEVQQLQKRDYELLSRVFAGMYGVQLGVEAYQAGDYARALAWLVPAAEEADKPSEKAAAHLHLGLIRKTNGDRRAAEAAFQAAAGQAGADPVFRSVAAGQLGGVRVELGDVAGARAAFRQAIDSGIPEVVAKAALNLGVLEDNAGHPDQAYARWEVAYRESSADRRIRAFAAYNLGWYWEQAGQPDRARPFYTEAARSKVPEAAARATERLGGLPGRSGLFRRRR